VVEQSAVNRLVGGSNPSSRAISKADGCSFASLNSPDFEMLFDPASGAPFRLRRGWLRFACRGVGCASLAGELAALRLPGSWLRFACRGVGCASLAFGVRVSIASNLWIQFKICLRWILELQSLDSYETAGPKPPYKNENSF
jgi:hypothetical protein